MEYMAIVVGIVCIPLFLIRGEGLNPSPTPQENNNPSPRIAFSAITVYTFCMANKSWQQLSAAIGNLFIDMGKILFGSLMLGSILKGEVDLFRLFVFGAASSTILFAAGVWFVSMSKE